MKIADMITLVNKYVGNGNYGFSELTMYFDECIDNINEDLHIDLPLISAVYEANGAFTPIQSEIDAGLVFTNNNTENEYTRVRDPYLRNYVCQQVAYRVLMDEDEAEEVLVPKQNIANTWYRKLIAKHNNYKLEDGEMIIMNGDVDELEGVTTDDEFANPYFLGDGE